MPAYIRSSYTDYLLEGVPKAFDDLVDISRHEPQTTQEIASQFISIAITVIWYIYPQGFREDAISLMRLTAICGAAAVPVMSAVCRESRDVAAVMSSLPESGVDIGEKVKAFIQVHRIVIKALEKLQSIHRLRMEPVLVEQLQKMRQQELAKEKLEEDSYSPIG